MANKIKTLRFPTSLENEINEFARINNLTFSAAVIELCQRSLYRTFDGEYAPKIAKCIKEENYKVLNRMEYLLQMYSEECTDRVLLYQQALFKQLYDDIRAEYDFDEEDE